MKRDPVVLIVIATVVTLMLVFGFNLARRSRDQANSHTPSLSGQPAPEFSLQALDGKTVKLSDFRGKAVLLNFWATWCEPCKLEMPWFVDLQKEYGPQGLQVIGVAMDDADPADIAKFAHDMHVDYPILVGKEAQRDELAKDYGGVQFLPETFYISRDGKVLDRAFGLKGKAEIEDSIKKALAQNAVAQMQKSQ